MVVLQWGPRPPPPPPASGQLASDVHWTQRIVVVLHAGARWVVHCALLVHETTHRFVAMSQTRPASPQLALLKHCTQVPAVEQYWPPGHCESVMQSTQEWDVVLQ